MFEKEATTIFKKKAHKIAETKVKEFYKECGWEDYKYMIPEFTEVITVGMKKGAEFGYNKANELHDLRKDPTDLPKDNDEKLCFYGKGKVVARYDSEDDCWKTEFNNLTTTFSSSILIAWKEIVLPEE